MLWYLELFFCDLLLNWLLLNWLLLLLLRPRMRLFCCCGLILVSYRSCGSAPRTAHGTCQPSGVDLLVSARTVALASHAIPHSVSVSAGQSPHEARSVVHAVRQLFSTGTESFPALPASSHPVAGNLSAFPDIAKPFFITC